MSGLKRGNAWVLCIVSAEVETGRLCSWTWCWGEGQGLRRQHVTLGLGVGVDEDFGKWEFLK